MILFCILGRTITDPEDFIQFLEKNNTDGKYHCTFCGYSHKVVTCAKNHVEAKHFDNSFTYNCPFCEMTFTNKVSFNNHKMKKHKWTRCFVAGISDPEDFVQFLEKHVDGKYYCRICNYSHKVITTVKNHVEAKHFDNSFTYNCPLCDQSFSNKVSLNNHRAKHKAAKAN